MSYKAWQVHGYGINTNEINTTVERVEVLLQMAPKFYDFVKEQFKIMDVESPELEDYLAIDDVSYSGIAYLLQEVVNYLV